MKFLKIRNDWLKVFQVAGLHLSQKNLQSIDSTDDDDDA